MPYIDRIFLKLLGMKVEKGLNFDPHETDSEDSDEEEKKDSEKSEKHKLIN